MLYNESPKLVSTSKFYEQVPFPFACFDDFLDEAFAEICLKEFPDQQDDEYQNHCIEDGGRVGTNYSNSDIQTWSDAFIELDETFKSKSFINHLEYITNINGLIYDPEYQGGGIRASTDSTFLPIHLDFNRHPRRPELHRRLNLLLYFNKDWSDEFGGSIQVHLDPNEVPAGKSLVSEFLPIFNRAFVFETSEKSWHGFKRLTLPSGRRRLLFSVYYYTLERPEGDVPFRNTEYVEPWVPEDIDLGENYEVISELLRRRDDRIKMLYELRREFDAKYSHLWSEYEYYLAKTREYQNKYGE